jgi:hypothetical protein
MLSLAKHLILFGLIRSMTSMNNIFKNVLMLLLEDKSLNDKYRIEAALEMCAILNIIKGTSPYWHFPDKFCQTVN